MPYNIVIDLTVRCTAPNRPTAMRPGTLPGASSSIGILARDIYPHQNLDIASVVFDDIPAFCSQKTVGL